MDRKEFEQKFEDGTDSALKRWWESRYSGRILIAVAVALIALGAWFS